MPTDLVTKLLEFVDAAVGDSPEELVQFFFCLIRIVHMKNESQLLLQQITAVQALITHGDLCKLCSLLVGQVLRRFA